MASDQRHLNAEACTADIAAEMENDHWESVRKLAQSHDVSTKTVQASLHKDLQLSKKWPVQRSGQVHDQTALQGEEGAIQEVRNR